MKICCETERSEHIPAAPFGKQPLVPVAPVMTYMTAPQVYRCSNSSRRKQSSGVPLSHDARDHCLHGTLQNGLARAGESIPARYRQKRSTLGGWDLVPAATSSTSGAIRAYRNNAGGGPGPPAAPAAPNLKSPPLPSAESGRLIWVSWKSPRGCTENLVSGNDCAAAGGVARGNVDSGAHRSAGRIGWNPSPSSGWLEHPHTDHHVRKVRDDGAYGGTPCQRACLGLGAGPIRNLVEGSNLRTRKSVGGTPQAPPAGRSKEKPRRQAMKSARIDDRRQGPSPYCPGSGSNPATQTAIAHSLSSSRLIDTNPPQARFWTAFVVNMF